MKTKFNATYKIDGQPQNNTMTYDDTEIIATLTRRIKTAFPNATEITIERAPEAKTK